MRALRRLDAQSLPETAALLAEGGDARIAIQSGRNEYGCIPYPDPFLSQFGSSTASTISASAFEAADTLRRRLHSAVSEFQRIRNEFLSLCGISDIDGLGMHFCPSGTDAHRLANRLVDPEHTLMVSGSETGRGVAHALSGKAVHELKLRDEHGMPRCGRDIDEEAAMRVESLVKRRGKVLVVLADVSKTGMIAPSLSFAHEMKERYPDSVEILVDACQFRLARENLRAYLEKGFMVAVTGSKFLTGPTFSGALLVPCSPVRPADLDENIGLLLRWEAALAELRLFLAAPEAGVENFLARFSDSIRTRLEKDPAFEPIPVPELKRMHRGWDSVQTIFPFLLKRKGRFLEFAEAKRIHALLVEDLSHVSKEGAFRCSFGQPVSCGALRICSSARIAVEGIENESEVIARAHRALDKAAWLVDLD